MNSLGKLLRSWIISENNYNPDALESDDIEWACAIPFILVNLSCLLVFYVRFSWIALVTAAFLYFFCLFTIGAFYHRYFSHRAFKTNRFRQFIFAALAGTSAQRGPLWWSDAGWFLTKGNFHYNPERVKDFECYPELVFIDRERL